MLSLIAILAIAANVLLVGIRIGQVITAYHWRNAMIERRVIASIRH